MNYFELTIRAASWGLISGVAALCFTTGADFFSSVLDDGCRSWRGRAMVISVSTGTAFFLIRRSLFPFCHSRT
jgi:hypothetical protein